MYADDLAMQADTASADSALIKFVMNIPCLTQDGLEINPCYAELIREKQKLTFFKFLHTEMAQVIEIWNSYS